MKEREKVGGLIEVLEIKRESRDMADRTCSFEQQKSSYFSVGICVL